MMIGLAIRSIPVVGLPYARLQSILLLKAYEIFASDAIGPVHTR